MHSPGHSQDAIPRQITLSGLHTGLWIADTAGPGIYIIGLLHIAGHAFSIVIAGIAAYIYLIPDITRLLISFQIYKRVLKP